MNLIKKDLEQLNDAEKQKLNIPVIRNYRTKSQKRKNKYKKILKKIEKRKKSNMKEPEDFLTKGKGNFINCCDYDDAIQAIKDYAAQFQNQPKLNIPDIMKYNKLWKQELYLK